jgi:membrane fusion protein (multidrug efflux system)
MRTGRLVAGTIVASLLLFSCAGRQADEERDFKVPVSVEAASRSSIEYTVKATGTLRAGQEAALDAVIGGYLRIGLSTKSRERLREGDAVDAGQFIAGIESEQNQVSKTAGIEAKRQAYDFAQSQYERSKNLFDKGILPESDLSQAKERMAAARYDYENAKVADARTRLASPLAGVVTELTKTVDGSWVPPGTRIAEIMDVSTVIADLEVPGGAVGELKTGQKARVSNYAYPGEAFEGTITNIRLTLDQQTRTFTAEVTVPNPELKLRPGMFVEAEIVVRSAENVLTVPKESVAIRENRTVVFVVDKQRAFMKPVTTGLEDKDKVEILTGISEGDRVVTAGYETLHDKTPVRVTG